MKNFFLLLTLILAYNFGNSQDYIGNWETPPNDGSVAYLTIDADSIYYYIYNDSDTCYQSTVYPYSNNGSDTLLFDVAGQDFFVTYEYSPLLGGVLTLANLPGIDDGLTVPFGSSNFVVDDLEICQDTSNNGPNQNLLGQWIEIESTVFNRYVVIDSTNLIIYQFSSAECYEVIQTPYVDNGNGTITVSGVATAPYTFSDNNDTLSLDIIGFGELNITTATFDTNDWIECMMNWECDEVEGCQDVGEDNGSFNTETSCSDECEVVASLEKLDSDIIVYPNPMNNHAKINSGVLIKSYSLFDVNGRLLRMTEVNSKQFILHKENLNSGIYFLEIKAEEKLIKEKLIIE